MYNNHMRHALNFALASLYLDAKQFIIKAGFASEIDWQASLNFNHLEEAAFLREAAWVVLSSGFRETVIRRKFNEISTAFKEFRCAREIVTNKRICRKDALKVFKNEKKIDAIVEIATRVHRLGFAVVKQHIASYGVSFLRTFPFLGPVTALHLAKNIGLDVVKPDRHLVRAAKSAGVSSAEELCLRIREIVGDTLAVIDLVIWRYATVNPKYAAEFSSIRS